MNENNKTNIYLKLFKVHVDKYNKTREIQWKVNFYFWAAVGAATSLLYGKFWPTNTQFFILSVVPSVMFYYLWILPISKSINTDREIYSKYRCRIESLIDEKEKCKTHKTSSKFDKWACIKLLITVFLFVGCLFILHEAPVKELTKSCS